MAAIPVEADLDFGNVSQILNYPGGFPPPTTNKFVTTFGNATDLTYTVAHTLNTDDLIVAVYNLSGGALDSLASVHVPDTGHVVVAFSSPPGIRKLVLLA